MIRTSVRAAIWATVAFAALTAEVSAHHVMGGATPNTFAQGLLSGLGHPIIGLDHLAAIVAVGCLAAAQRAGALLAIGYVIAMIIGAALHGRAMTVPAAEVLVGLSVIVLGALLIRPRALAAGLMLALFALAGLIHGYALGETIVGAEPAPLYAYFIGLALVQSVIALVVMTLVRRLATSLEPAAARLVGAGVAGVGLAILVQQLAA